MTNVDLFTKIGSDYYNTFINKIKEIESKYPNYEIWLNGTAVGAIESLNATTE